MARRIALDEEWRPCKSYSDLEASSLGRVRLRGRVLRPHYWKRRFCIRLPGGKRERITVARLVAEAFLSLPPLGSGQGVYRIRHLNDSLTDNRPTNLLVVRRARFDSLDLARANALHEEGLSSHTIMELTGVTESALRRYRQRLARQKEEAPVSEGLF